MGSPEEQSAPSATSGLGDASEVVCIRAPGSLSNLGPGFDTLGVAITGVGDVVTVSWSEDERSGVNVVGEGVSIPTDPLSNTASVAALQVARAAGERRGLLISIQKGIPLASGLGGSAASAAAGALAAHVLTGNRIDRRELLRCALSGEAVASGSIHGDNVVPALVGGGVLVDPIDPIRYRRIGLGKVHFAIVVPALEIETSGARLMLPDMVPLSSATRNSAALGLLVHSLMVGDIRTAGQMIMRDQIVEPVRARQIPCWDAVKTAALDSGAFGCAVSGSGPAIVAVAETEEAAAAICRAMEEAAVVDGRSPRAFVARPDDLGAREI